MIVTMDQHMKAFDWLDENVELEIWNAIDDLRCMIEAVVYERNLK